MTIHVTMLLGLFQNQPISFYGSFPDFPAGVPTPFIVCVDSTP